MSVSRYCREKMCCLFILLWMLSLIINGCNATSHANYTHTSLSKTISPIFISTFNNSTTPTSMTTNNRSRIASTTSIFDPDSNISNDSITVLPAPFYFLDHLGQHLRNYEHIKAGFCDISDSFCWFKEENGTIRKATPNKMEDRCVLWDDTCSGDRKLAIEKFFDSTLLLGGNSCFEQTPGVDSSACLNWNPPSRLLEWQKIKEWMSSSQCKSALTEYDELRQTHNTTSKGFVPDDSTCCLRCYLQAENVDIYYWPEPDSDTSCLSIVGQSVRPLDYGATKVSVSVLHELTQRMDILTYWGCTASTLKTEVLTSQGQLTTWLSRDTIAIAKVTTIGSLSVKVSVFNPWSSLPCSQEDATYQVAKRTAEPRSRMQSLNIPPSVTQNNGLPVSTVSDGFTL